MIEQSKISEIKGVGAKTEQSFRKLGVETVGDLIRYYPRSYQVYEEAVPVSEVEEGRVMTVSGAIFGRVQVSGNRNMQVTTLYVKDLTGSLKVIWFRMPFLRTTLSKGGVITLRGKIVSKKGTLVMEHPEIFYPAAQYDAKLDTLQPVYGLTSGITNNAVMKAVRTALGQICTIQDTLPKEICRRYGLPTIDTAIQAIHFPKNKETFYPARNRLVFEEFLDFILSLRQLKESNVRLENHFHMEEKTQIHAFLKQLPFHLTKAQLQVWEDIKKDMSGPNVMSRLVQGDVGSGKTIVAVLGLMLAGLNGCQGAMMAPTEVLAKQHFESIGTMFSEYGVPLKTELLTGSMTAKEKRLAYERIESGEVDIIIGTHALIQEKVVYRNLALVITDEQHRFGVKQREKFAEKGNSPHFMVMSATPIPRTLAIILYGELDISVIDELPANRLPIKNCVVDTGYRPNAYHFMEKQIAEGRQCYVICPMVEESETLEAENVMDYAENLREELHGNCSIAYLHGKMKQDEKDDIMTRFAKNEIQILVSTTVIEVGIDVPNSTVMLIENSERFGLAQLHQLRGRVGRGKYQSYCIFMTASKTKETKERLEILNKSNDGFFIASEDLRLRGPGDLFGIRQSGLMDFRLGDIYQDAKILQEANEAADWMMKNLSEDEITGRLKKDNLHIL
ncbi:MAG: ATP-dependent DNA helicase RecG [Hespellia sp.]|nr:ATP-dependent DNA helicase RecG [Hespellia sp.]